VGLDELLHGEGMVVIEWPENVANALPEKRLWVALEFVDDQARRLTFQASGARAVALLAALEE
jgi:tRNA threonylcarbamoyladenosine biosynthesis protein TsaE